MMNDEQQSFIESHKSNVIFGNAPRLRSRGGSAAVYAPRDRSRGALSRHWFSDSQ